MNRDYVKYLRVRRGETQRQFAKAVRVSYDTVKSWETGRLRITSAMRWKIRMAAGWPSFGYDSVELLTLVLRAFRKRGGFNSLKPLKNDVAEEAFEEAIWLAQLHLQEHYPHLADNEFLPR